MQISVRELMTSDLFRDSSVVAGLDGLDRRILSLNVLENERGYAFAEKDMLIVTSGYFFKQDPTQLESVIPLLADRRVACLAMKTNFFNGSVPDAICAAADKVGLPVIALQNDTLPFRDFFRFFETNIYARGLKSYLSNDTLTALLSQAMHESGIPALSKRLFELTGRPVFFQLRKELYCYPEDGGGFDITQFSYQTEHHSSDFQSDPDFLTITSPIKALGAPLWYRRHHVGTIWLTEAATAFDDNDFQILRQARQAGELDISQLFLYEDKAKRLKDNLVRSLLNGRISNIDELYELAKGTGWQLPSRLRIVAIQGPQSAAFSERMEAAILELFRHERHTVETQIYESLVLLFMPAEIDDWTATADKLMTHLTHSMPNSAFLIACGNPVDILRTSVSYRQAMYALKVGPIIKPGIKLYDFKTLGIFRLMSSTGDDELRAVCREMLEPLIESDTTSKLELIRTLNSYYHSGCNFSQTGKDLFVHPNTVRYRLGVVEELCGISLNKYNDSLTLQVALALMPLLYPNC